ncbi:MAG: hypothetical protein HUJ74_01285 [Lachnospiraceae bacterium]|nr:hypothetical protein [Lachnospiraceae bacterium]
MSIIEEKNDVEVEYCPLKRKARIISRWLTKSWTLDSVVLCFSKQK